MAWDGGFGMTQESVHNMRNVRGDGAGRWVGRRAWVRSVKMVKMAFQISMIETPREPGKTLFHAPSLGMLRKLWSAPKRGMMDFVTSVFGAAS